MAWTVKIGQFGDPTGVRTQERITSIRVTEGFGLVDFSVTIKNPIPDERTQAKGRIDAAVIQIKRREDILVDGYIEDVENGADYVKYTGRSFLVLLGYSTESTTGADGKTAAEYDNAGGNYGAMVIEHLINDYCSPYDAELTHSISLKDKNGDDVIYGGIVRLHGKKVYQIIKEMCQSYGHDLWSTVVLDVNDDVTSKIVNVGIKERGNSVTAYKTLQGGVQLKGIPIVKYRSSQSINCLRVIGGGTGKDKVSVLVKDQTSIDAIGRIEGEPYHNNMVRSIATAQSVGEAIIDAKKDPIEELHVELAIYVSDLRYGDWVNVIDDYSNIDTIKRIKSITSTYSISTSDKMSIELGDKFDNYQNIIRDLTKGDVDGEPDMTVAGGSLRITSNDPPDTYVRIDGGDWYGTDGTLYHFGDSVVPFWGGEPPYNATTVGNYFKALVQIKDNAISSTDIIYKTNLTVSSHTGYADKSDAENDIISADFGYTPIGEVILKCCNISGTVCIISDLNEGNSYYYRDARPIVGSSAAGYGNNVWEKNVSNFGVLQDDIVKIDMEGKSITSTGGTNMIFEVGVGNAFIFKKV